MAPISVLYVDDEQGLLELGKAFVESIGGFRIDLVDSAVRALELLTTTRYDAIVSDYQMPEMDGLEFLRQVRLRYGQVPFILFTGRGREEVVIEAINRGVDFYLQKGGEPQPEFAELGLKIRQAVQRRRAEDDLQKSENLYRTVFSNTGAATIIIAPDTTIMLANDGWVRMTGIPREEQENKLSWTVFFDSEDVERMKKYHYLRRQDPSLAPHVYESRLVDVQKKSHYCFVHVEMIPGTKNSVASLVDITERRHAEDELRAAYEQLTAAQEELQAQFDELKYSDQKIRESEQTYRNILESIQECYYRTDEKGDMILASPSVAGVLGYSDPEELYGRDLATTIYLNPEDRKVFLAHMERTGSVRNYEARLKKKDGTPITVITSSHKYYDATGKFLGVEGIFRDITERKTAETALKASEEKFAKTFQSSPDLILLSTIPGAVITEVNESVRQFGFEPQEMVGHTVSDLNLWVDNTGARETYKAIIRRDGRVLNFEAEFRKKNGEIFTGLISGTIIMLEAGPCFVSIVHDITDRKRAEIEMRRIAQEWQQTFDASTDAVFILDRDQRIIRSNAAAVQIFNHTTDEMQGHLCWEIVHHTSSPITGCPVTKARQSHKKENMELEIDGRWYLVSVHPFIDDQGRFSGAVHVASDITEHRQAVEAIRIAHKKLALLSGITRHDIINQLTILKGYLALLESFTASGEEAELVRKVSDSADRIDAMIQFTRQYDKIGIETPVWRQVKSLVTDAVWEVRQKVVRIDNTIPEGYEIFVDPLIGRVFYNLLENAIRHGGTITTVRLSLAERESTLILTCEDDGTGVADAEKEKIFLRGYGKHTGMGLFLARDILAITGITIRENGTPGRGARFEISVPDGAWRSGPRTG